MKATMKKEMNNMPMFKIKAKAEFEVVVEAKNKAEANDWAEQVLTDIIDVDVEYSDRIQTLNKDVKVSKAKLQSPDEVKD
jgi:chemotaxis response regulator CheB